ncbi:serine/threonine-protein kinase [Myxococcaceae bacterium GXIMD 01537]
MPELRPGTDVSGYVVETKLGAGGFGTVYRARRGGRPYALKLLDLRAVGGWAEREVAILLRLKHPNVVGFVGCGFWPDDSARCLCIGMEFIEGRQLDVWAAEENPSAREVVRKVLGAARGLAAVHAAKVVHRDVKESNILVRASDGEAVLVDFGAGGYEGAPGLTLFVLPPGTPQYRSPEAWRFLEANSGKPGAKYIPTPADDVYALGVVLYRLLTDAAPYEAGDDQELIAAIVHHEPVAPHVLNPRVPAALGQLCMRMLAKRPEDRIPDAESLVRELDGLGAGASESWDVPLCDAHGPDTATTQREGAPRGEAEKLNQWLHEPLHRPRRGKRPPPVENPTPEPARAPRTGARRGLAGWGLAALVLAVGGGAAYQFRPVPAESILGTAPRMQLEPGREVARPGMPPEVERGAAPPGATTPAPVALATTLKDETRVKIPLKKNGLGSVGKVASVVAVACVGAACPGPHVRPTPPPEDCPPGAVEAMEKFGIRVVLRNPATFPVEAGAKVVAVREGPASVELLIDWEKLPDSTWFSGRLVFGDRRVYGRFTKAHTRDGEFPVCLDLLDLSRRRGVEMEPGSTSEEARIWSTVEVQAVGRFE